MLDVVLSQNDEEQNGSGFVLNALITFTLTINVDGGEKCFAAEIVIVYILLNMGRVKGQLLRLHQILNGIEDLLGRHESVSWNRLCPDCQ